MTEFLGQFTRARIHFQPGSAYHPWFLFFLVYMSPGWSLLELCFSNSGLTQVILKDSVSKSFIRPQQFLSFVWQFHWAKVFHHKFNRHAFAYARNQRNHVRSGRFHNPSVIQTDSQVIDLCTLPQT